MKTYVVNMEKDEAKRAQILAQTSKFSKIQVNLVKACEGRKLLPSELDRLGYEHFRRRYNDFGTLPAFGCSVSHKCIYEEIVKNDIKGAIILEDDAILSPEFQNVVELLMPRLFEDTVPVAILLTPEFLYRKQGVHEPICSGYKLVDVLSGYMTSGYMLNNKAARLLLEAQTPVSYVADAWGDFISRGLSLKGVVTHIVSYPDALGEIGRSQLNGDGEPFYKEIRHKCGRLKAQIFSAIRYFRGIRESRKTW